MSLNAFPPKVFYVHREPFRPPQKGRFGALNGSDATPSFQAVKVMDTRKVEGQAAMNALFPPDEPILQTKQVTVIPSSPMDTQDRRTVLRKEKERNEEIQEKQRQEKALEKKKLEHRNENLNAIKVLRYKNASAAERQLLKYVGKADSAVESVFVTNSAGEVEGSRLSQALLEDLSKSMGSQGGGGGGTKGVGGSGGKEEDAMNRSGRISDGSGFNATKKSALSSLAAAGNGGGGGGDNISINSGLDSPLYAGTGILPLGMQVDPPSMSLHTCPAWQKGPDGKLVKVPVIEKIRAIENNFEQYQRSVAMGLRDEILEENGLIPVHASDVVPFPPFKYRAFVARVRSADDVTDILTKIKLQQQGVAREEQGDGVDHDRDDGTGLGTGGEATPLPNFDGTGASDSLFQTRAGPSKDKAEHKDKERHGAGRGEKDKGRYYNDFVVDTAYAYITTFSSDDLRLEWEENQKLAQLGMTGLENGMPIVLGEPSCFSADGTCDPTTGDRLLNLLHTLACVDTLVVVQQTMSRHLIGLPIQDRHERTRSLLETAKSLCADFTKVRMEVLESYHRESQLAAESQRRERQRLEQVEQERAKLQRQQEEQRLLQEELTRTVEKYKKMLTEQKELSAKQRQEKELKVLMQKQEAAAKAAAVAAEALAALGSQAVVGEWEKTGEEVLMSQNLAGSGQLDARAMVTAAAAAAEAKAAADAAEKAKSLMEGGGGGGADVAGVDSDGGEAGGGAAHKKGVGASKRSVKAVPRVREVLRVKQAVNTPMGGVRLVSVERDADADKGKDTNSKEGDDPSSAASLLSSASLGLGGARAADPAVVQSTEKFVDSLAHAVPLPTSQTHTHSMHGSLSPPISMSVTLQAFGMDRPFRRDPLIDPPSTASSAMSYTPPHSEHGLDASTPLTPNAPPGSNNPSTRDSERTHAHAYADVAFGPTLLGQTAALEEMNEKKRRMRRSPSSVQASLLQQKVPRGSPVAGVGAVTAVTFGLSPSSPHPYAYTGGGHGSGGALEDEVQTLVFENLKTKRDLKLARLNAQVLAARKEMRTAYREKCVEIVQHLVPVKLETVLHLGEIKKAHSGLVKTPSPPFLVRLVFMCVAVLLDWKDLSWGHMRANFCLLPPHMDHHHQQDNGGGPAENKNSNNHNSDDGGGGGGGSVNGFKGSVLDRLDKQEWQADIEVLYELRLQEKYRLKQLPRPEEADPLSVVMPEQREFLKVEYTMDAVSAVAKNASLYDTQHPMWGLVHQIMHFPVFALSDAQVAAVNKLLKEPSLEVQRLLEVSEPAAFALSWVMLTLRCHDLWVTCLNSLNATAGEVAKPLMLDLAHNKVALAASQIHALGKTVDEYGRHAGNGTGVNEALGATTYDYIQATAGSSDPFFQYRNAKKKKPSILPGQESTPPQGNMRPGGRGKGAGRGNNGGNGAGGKEGTGTDRQGGQGQGGQSVSSMSALVVGHMNGGHGPLRHAHNTSDRYDALALELLSTRTPYVDAQRRVDHFAIARKMYRQSRLIGAYLDPEKVHQTLPTSAKGGNR